jgi:hypothetical protein
LSEIVSLEHCMRSMNALSQLLLHWLVLMCALAHAAPAQLPANPIPADNSVGTSEAYKEIDDYIEQQMNRLAIPGAVLAVVDGKTVVHVHGFGAARRESGAPSSQTPFFLGSITKSFTALAVMQLVEAGKVSLDAPVQRYLPWFRVADPQASAQMTAPPPQSDEWTAHECRDDSASRFRFNPRGLRAPGSGLGHSQTHSSGRLAVRIQQ